MATSLSPCIVLRVSDSIASGSSATVTLPAGTWRLVSVQATSNANTNKIDVKNNAGTVMLAATAVATTTGTILAASDTTQTTTTTIKVGCTTNGPIANVFLTLAPAGASVNAPVVSVAAT